jgi:hypothetical protein
MRSVVVAVASGKISGSRGSIPEFQWWPCQCGRETVP